MNYLEMCLKLTYNMQRKPSNFVHEGSKLHPSALYITKNILKIIVSKAKWSWG